jgi:simple sugar transport system substrate-binding protein
MRRALAGLVLLAALLVGGCGGTEVVREDPIVVAGDTTQQRAQARAATGDAVVRIAVVTHGQASSPFWATVRNGVEAAARQNDVLVNYRAPEVYSVARMKEMIDDAVASRPDGLVVSIPEPGLAPAIRRAVRAGIPVVSINSGNDVFRRLGVLAHVGQPEERAGYLAGRRLAAAGVRRALCVNQQVGNQGLDARCRGLSRALRDAGGRSLTIGVDDQSPATPGRLATAIAGGRIDGLLALNGTSGVLAAEAIERAGRQGEVTAGTFDLGAGALEAVRDRRLAFAVDQQPYLQGYWPVTLLAQRARYGLFLGERQVLPTGPSFVTPDTAAAAIDLSRRSIR